jgi:hypothetical protein
MGLRAFSGSVGYHREEQTKRKCWAWIRGLNGNQVALSYSIPVFSLYLRRGWQDQGDAQEDHLHQGDPAAQRGTNLIKLFGL